MTNQHGNFSEVDGVRVLWVPSMTKSLDSLKDRSIQRCSKHKIKRKVEERLREESVEQFLEHFKDVLFSEQTISKRHALTRFEKF